MFSFKPNRSHGIAAALFGIFTVAVAAGPAQAASNYDAFGQRPGLDVVVTDFLTNVLADPRIKSYFTNANIPVLHVSLVNQFCMLEGGPCPFTENMKALHENLGITQAAFNALAEDLQVSMNKHDIPLTAQNDLLGKLAPMAHDIVTK
jgi:hemoglobin